MSNNILPNLPAFFVTNSPQWYPEVFHFCPTTPIILLGLKSDLRNSKTCVDLLKTQGLTPVTPEQGRTVAKKIGALYMECSSKEKRGVQEIFDTAVSVAVGKPASTEGGNTDSPYGLNNMRRIKKRSCRIL